MNIARRDLAERLDARRADLVARIVDSHYRARPDLARRYGPQGRMRCEEDAEFHLNYLAEAIRAGSAALFVDYVIWARDLLESRNVPATDLEENLGFVSAAIESALDPADVRIVRLYLEAGREAVRATDPPPDAAPGALTDLARRYLLALLEGNRVAAEGLVTQALAEGTPIREIYLTVFEAVQREVGRRWQRNRITVAQEHLCTAATERIMARLFARHVVHAGSRRNIVIASVSSELHAMGPRILADFFEMDGWEVHYLGANTPATSVVEIVRDRQAAALAVSATMTFHLPHVRDLIIRVRARPELNDVKVLVGGHPFNIDRDLWRKVGADGYAADAPGAVAEARRLTGAT